VLNEADLLARARANETDALAQIHDMYYGPIVRYVSFRVNNRSTIEDLASEVFIRFLSALRERKAPQNTLRGWLYAVAANVVSDYHRRRYRAPAVDLDEEIISQEAGPAEVVESRLAREDLRRAMATLTDEQQNVIALRFGSEMPIQDVARTLGKTEGAIKQLQARAIAALARTMAPGTVE
jgi:RNA polymerase sigma-70 factor (ECF subfamily)